MRAIHASQFGPQGFFDATDAAWHSARLTTFRKLIPEQCTDVQSRQQMRVPRAQGACAAIG